MSTTPSENAASYLIQLDAFNITKDWVPQKPYTNADYQKAKDNVDGINAAIDYAINTLQVKTVKLPSGNYTFTYLNRPMGSGHIYENKTCVLIPSHTTLDISGCRIEMMYDSINRSPYDETLDPVYKFSGYAFGFYHAEKTTLTGGEILGDRYLRDYVSGEAAEETTCGVMHNFGSRYCEINGTTIRGFMGDNIIIGNYPGVGTIEDNDWNPPFTLGDILADGSDDVGYTPQSLNNAFKTGFITLPGDAGQYRKICIITGVGFARIPAFHNAYSSFYWYDDNHNFIASETNQILEETKRPQNAKYLRIVTRNEPSNDPTLRFGIQVASNPCTSFTIKNCDLSDSNRGGISGGTNHTLIQSCRIYNNGMGWKEQKSNFPDSTRYQINFEDSYCLGMTVEHCDIGEGFHGILAGVYNALITGNRFYNLATGVVAYNMNLMQVSDNKFNTVNEPLTFQTSPDYSRRRVLFSGNYVRGFGGFAAYGLVELKANYFESGRVDFDRDSNISENHFVDCTFSYSSFGPKVCNNIFESSSQIRTYFDLSAQDTVVHKNQFRNYIFQINNGGNINVDFLSCILDNTVVAYTAPVQVKAVSYIDCILKNGSYHFNGCYGSPANGAYPKVNFINSKIHLNDDIGSAYFDAQHSAIGLVGTYNNNPGLFINEVAIKDCTFYLKGSNTATVLGASPFGYGYTGLTIDNVVVKRDAANTGNPTFRWFAAIEDSAVAVRNSFTIEDGIIYTDITDSKFQKNTAAPAQLPKFIGEEYIWFDNSVSPATVNIMKGVNTASLATAWIQIN